MEIVNDFFKENMADLAQQEYFNLQTINATAPGDKDEDDDTEDAEEGANKSESTDDDNPPIDKEVVHSPLSTQPGGKPGR